MNLNDNRIDVSGTPDRLEPIGENFIDAVYEGPADDVVIRVRISDDDLTDEAIRNLRDEIIDGYNETTEKSQVRAGSCVFFITRDGVKYEDRLVIEENTLYEWEALVNGKRMKSGHKVGPLSTDTTFSVSLGDFGHTTVRAEKIAEMAEKHRSLYKHE